MAINKKTRDLVKSTFGGGALKNAKARVDSNWIRPGHYLMRIDRVKLDQNRKDETMMFIEMTPVHVYDNDDGAGHRVGEAVSHGLMKKHDAFLGNVKAFLAAAMGCPAEEIGEDEILAVLDDDEGVLNGTVVEVFAKEIVTKANRPFTSVKYRREVPALELLEILSEETQKLYFPDDELQKIAAADAA